MLGQAGHFSSLSLQVGGDAGDVEVNKRLLSFWRHKEVTVGLVVHE